MTIHRPLIALLPLILLACAPQVGHGPGGENPGRDTARIEVVGASSLQVEEGAALEIGFRYLDEANEIVPGAIIDFAIEGDASGASLSAASASTDDEGIAYATVRTGSDGAFEVVASAGERAEPASARVEVRPMVYGTLGVEVSYMGTRALTGAELALFVNASCEDLGRSVPSPEMVARVSIGSRTEIDGLALDVPMAVYVLGIDRADVVAAETCTDVTMTEPAVEIHVPLADVAVAVRGPYDTVEVFDVTDGFPSGIDTILEVSAGLASGDPALWLVEMVADHRGAPGWLRTALGSSFTRSLVADLLRDALDGIHIPSEVTEMARFGADVDAAFRALTFEGELTFGGPDEYGVAMGRHHISQIRVHLSDGESVRPIDAGADVVVTFGERIDIDEHALPISFGEVVQLVLYEAILSRMSGRHETLGDLVGSYFDCDAIAMRIGSGTTATIARAACSAGVSMLQDRIDNALLDLFRFDTLYLSGSADLRDTDNDYDLETIADGEATARWVGSSGELEFDGTFTGLSSDDPASVHRVRERISGLE